MRAYDLTNLQLLLAKTDQQPELSVPSSTAYPIGMPLRDFLLAWAERPEGYPAGSVRVFRRTGQTFVAGSDDLLNAIEGLRGATMLPVQAVELEPGEPGLIELTTAEAAGVIAGAAARG